MLANNLVINANKMVAINLAATARNFDYAQVFDLNSETMLPYETAKYMGVTFDNQLSFKTHISVLENKMAQSVEVIAKVSHRLPQNSLLTLFIHFLLSMQICSMLYLCGHLNLKSYQNYWT